MSSKPTVGHVTGDLTLTIDDSSVALGTVSIPLVAETTHTPRGPITVGIQADLAEVRQTIVEIFNEEAS